jgi:glycerol-3-phosphate dehydrogenase
MRGVKVALVEQNDFASGTSSRSSRLLHGGLRYLAQGRVGLVREASREKMTIHRIAPHLAQALPFILPTYKGNRDWIRWQLRIGVKIYDLLCGKRNFGKSGSFDAGGMRELLPGVNEHDLTGGVRYYDALTNDARLVLDTLRSAASHGGTVLNYTSLRSANPAGGKWECELHDRLSGATAQITPAVIVNAAGPWADKLPASSVKLRLSKGVHLVVMRDRLNVPEAVVMTDGKRILFAIPWGERVILGTTDTDYPAGDLENPACEPADVEYILKVTNRTFPKASLTSTDIIGTWAGLRPLIADPNGSPSDISREHEIHMPQPGWFDVAGGKLTTYRLMAEQTADRIVKHLGLKNAGPCRTTKEPLVLPNQTTFSGVVPPAVSREAVEHYCRHEWAVHLDDVMVRRSSWQHYHAESAEIAKQVAEWMAAELNWSADRTVAELERYGAIVRASRV